jgi:arginyl-tRNA synthetase
MSATDQIRAALRRAARELGASDAPEPVLERPRDPAHGDWFTNFAMVLARPLKRKPLDIAKGLQDNLDLVAAGVRAIEIAGPGFINFRMDTGTVARGLAAIIAADANYGRADLARGEPANVEFVSANPTGPLHVGHGRQAALGDAIATLLEWTGWKVSREFYYNDAGAQIENLALSIWARAAEILGFEAAVPAGGYHGAYIREIAQKFVDANRGKAGVVEKLAAGARALVARGAASTIVPTDGGDAGTDDDDDDGGTALANGTAVGASRPRGALPAGAADDAELDPSLLDEIRRFGIAELRAEQDLDLRAFGVKFDVYYLETSLYTDGRVDRTVEMLRAAGHTYEKDGALWLRTTDFGDDKDRVMRKRAEKGGGYTYFLPDVAYHVAKWERGFRRAINVQGSDHHSTVSRVRIGLQALEMGVPKGYPDYVLHSMVTVMRGGEEVKISKRAGSYVTVRDLIDEVGRDAVRWFFVMRKGESQLSFDVDLARSQSDENPVYYVQMAHARMRGIFRVGNIDPATVTGTDVDLGVLSLAEEIELTKALLDFPAVVQGAAEALEPHRVASYLLETARKAHLWYHKAHVLLEGDDDETSTLRNARLVLARASQVVLRNGLSVLGISAPERM